MLKKTLGIIFLLVLISSISAEPPFIPSTNFPGGYIIEHPNLNYLEKSQDYTFNFHVYNFSDGYPINKNISCYFHLYNSTGNHILQLFNDTSTNFDYQFIVSGNNFSDYGKYSYIIQCNSSTNGGFSQDLFEVNHIGNNLEILYFILIFGFMFLSLILYYIGSSFEKDKNYIKSFFYISSLLFNVLSINTSKILVEHISDLNSMASTGLIFIIIINLIMFLYVFIYALVDVFKQIKNKQAIRWNY